MLHCCAAGHLRSSSCAHLAIITRPGCFLQVQEPRSKPDRRSIGSPATHSGQQAVPAGMAAAAPAPSAQQDSGTSSGNRRSMRATTCNISCCSQSNYPLHNQSFTHSCQPYSAAHQQQPCAQHDTHTARSSSAHTAGPAATPAAAAAHTQHRLHHRSLKG